MKIHVILLPIILLFYVVSPVYGAPLHCPKIDKDDEKNKAIARNYYKLGLSFQKQGDPRKFIEAYECVLTLVPYSVTARYKLAEALDFAGQYSRAITQYTMYLAVSKDQALKEKVKARIEAIRNLTDKALPPDENATKDELEQSKAAVKKRFDTELQNKLAELKAATKRTEDYEKKRQALLEEYRKKEKTRLDELEIRIKRLDALEKLSQKNKVLIKYIKTGPSHRTEHSTLRKWGMGTTAFGLLVGLAAVGTYFYKMQLTDEVSSTSTQEKKDYNSDLSDVNKGYSKTDVLYWEDSKARSPYMTVDMLGMLSNGLGIFAGVVVITGTVLFFMGESRKVKVDYNADIKGDEPSKGITYSFTPMLTQGGGGISFETRW